MNGAISNALRNALADALRPRAAREPAMQDFVNGLAALECLDTPEATRSLAPAAEAHLSGLLDGLACPPALAGAIRAFAPTVDWYQILEGAPVAPALEQGLIVGAPAVPADPPARMGLFLIAPNVHYPLHQHAAHEVYFVVSGEIDIQHGTTGAPQRVRAPDHLVTPVNRVHSLTTGDTPCLIAYVWTGDLTTPSGWWWEQDSAGDWIRVRWIRGADGRWAPHASEKVSDAVMREAGEP